MQSRAIIGPRDLIRDTLEAQRMSLLFDQIIIWPIDRKDVTSEEITRTETDMAFLRENNLVIKIGMEIPPIFSIQSTDGSYINPFGAFTEDSDWIVPWGNSLSGRITNGYEFDHEVDQMIYSISTQIICNEIPVVAHAKPSNLIRNQSYQPTAIEVIIKDLPLPSENLPWSDFIQFRNDSENQAKLRAFRVWIEKRGTSNDSITVMLEELRTLLDDYRRYMDIQKIKHGNSLLSTLVVSTTEVVANIAALNFGLAVKSILDIKSHNIALSEAELIAPGREVSYFSKAKDFLEKSS